jgi:hypothetical protein
MNNKNSNKSLNKNPLLNTSRIYDIAVEGQKRIFDNPYLISIILLMATVCIGYAIYYYYTHTTLNIKASSSYYGKDLAFYTPVFNNAVLNVNDCVTQCQNDLTCDGITYNSSTSFCTGTKSGTIRTDLPILSAWVKPVVNLTGKNISNIAQTVVIGNIRTTQIVDKVKFRNPYLIGQFSYSFTLTIFDFYKNYGVWRHIFHKGSGVDTNVPLNYQSWETLSSEIPDQTIGVWIAPFTNNLRIAISTTTTQGKPSGSYPDAFVQKCNPATNNCFITDLPTGKWVDTSRLTDGSIAATKITQQLEYFDHDLQNIPINTKVTFTVNIIGNYVELFMNGKITKTAMLNGVANYNNKPLYALFNNTVNCELKNLIYYPTNLLLGDIKTIMALS